MQLSCSNSNCIFYVTHLPACICLLFSLILSYVNRHRDPTFATSFPEVGKWPIHVQISHYATVCCRRLDRIGSHGRRQAKKPTEDEVEQARVSYFLGFGNYRFVNFFNISSLLFSSPFRIIFYATACLVIPLKR